MSSSSSSSPSPIPEPVPVCIICDEAASGLGPFSRRHLCQQHLAIDVADVRRLQREVQESLRPFTDGMEGREAALEAENLRMEQLRERVRATVNAVHQVTDAWGSQVTAQVTARQNSVQTCLRNLRDIRDYNREVTEAERAGSMASVCELAESMEISVRDLHDDFARAAQLRAESEGAELRDLRKLQKLQRMLDSLAGGADADATDAAVTARPETSDAAVTAGDDAASEPGPVGDLGQIVWSHELKLDGDVEWVTVCSDTSGFRGDRSGRVVPAESAGDGSSVALPQPCLIASVWGQQHLTVLSVDGTVRLRCQCPDISWRDIRGLHSARQQLFIAQESAVTVTDLSGRVIRKIRPDTAGFGSIGGIGGNAASVFVSGGNKILSFSIATGQLESLISLTQLPDADLRNLVIHGSCVLVTDRKHHQVHRVRTDTQQLVATHPTPRAGLARFEWPQGVAVDGRGRVFVSEWGGHSVRAVAADDGSLLWTLGAPGQSGSGRDRLNGPCGLAVVLTGAQQQQLVVADCDNQRLLVFNLP